GFLAETLQALVGPEIRLLHHVSRVFLVPGEPVSERIHVGVRRPYQFLEGSAVTRLGGGHQLCLVHASLGPRERRHGYLARLLVEGVLAVPAAVLLHLDALAVVLLVLHRDVVAPLAGLAGQRDLDSLIAPGHFPTPT